MPPIAPLPTVDGGFKVLIGDPPWSFRNGNLNGDPNTRYETLSTSEICAMPVKDIVAKDAALFLWCPSALLPDGLQVVEDWGFTYRTLIPWIKTRKSDGEISHGGLGKPWRSVHEPLIYAVRRNARANATQTGLLETNEIEHGVVLQAPRGHHSQKPISQYALIEKAYPTGPRLELFARHTRPGWTAWGQEAGHDEPASILRSGRRFNPSEKPAERHSQLPHIRPYGRLDSHAGAAFTATVAKLYERGWSISRIAKNGGYSEARVRSALLTEDVDLRPQGRPRKGVSHA